MECKIFLASFTAHNKGIIDRGIWIDLTDAKAYDKIKAVMDEREGHEFFIANSIASLPLEISEYDDPYKLADFVKRLEKLDDTQLDAYETIVSELGWDREEALNTAESWEFDAIEWDCTSIEEAVGYYYAGLNGYTDNDEISRYFNYEAYGSDICINSYVCDNGKTIFVIH